MKHEHYVKIGDSDWAAVEHIDRYKLNLGEGLMLACRCIDIEKIGWVEPLTPTEFYMKQIYGDNKNKETD